MKDGRWWRQAAFAVLLVLVGTLLLRSLWRPAMSLLESATPGEQAVRVDWQQRERQLHAADNQLREQLAEQLRRERRREQLLLTPECRFWWQQDQYHPTPRTVDMRQHYCDT